MKEAGNVDDIDLLLSDMSHHEKTILADLDRLGNVTTDREWRENTAKVCSATYMHTCLISRGVAQQCM